jgi:hypothetical protein
VKKDKLYLISFLQPVIRNWKKGVKLMESKHIFSASWIGDPKRKNREKEGGGASLAIECVKWVSQ